VPTVLAIVCLFLSGVAGLIYEVVWIRRAALVFGSTTYALSTVLAVFFLGLAAGSWLFGDLSRRLARPLRVYALLEIGLAALALASLAAFDRVEPLYGAVYRAYGPGSAALTLARIGLVSLILLPPAALMGGTLPLFCQQVAARTHRIAGSVGFLYGLNTLGAALGCALAGFALVPGVGMSRSVLVAALLNLTAGAVVAALPFAPLAPRPAAPAREPGTRADPPRSAVVAALVFMSGAIALGHEVLWTRFLSLLVRNTVYTYTLTLAVVLAGIVIGSWIAGRLFDRALPRAAIFGALQVLIGAGVLALLLLPPALWDRLGEGLALYAALLLPAAILSGASFPLAVRMIVDDPALAGFGVGRIAAFNTLGGIVGSLAIGFLALPRLGLHASLLVTTGASVATGIAAWMLLDRATALGVRLAVSAAGAALWIAVPSLERTRLPAAYLANGGELVDYREGLQSDLAVVRREGVLNLEIDRLWQGQSRKTHQIMAAHLPMLLHPHPRRVMVVGVGAGQTPGRFLLYGIEKLDCVDIEPAVFDLIRSHFDTAWMADPRVTLIRADGRNVLTHTRERYDVISLEIGQIFRPGVGAFYTRDFYRRARARLLPGGLVSQFVPLSFLPPEAFRSVVRTFLDVFPRSVLWYNTSELLLVGVNGDSLALGEARLGLLASDARIHDDLRYGHWGGAGEWLNHPRMVMAGFLAGPRGLASLAGGAPAYRDDRPALDYATTALDVTRPTELPNLALLREHLDPVAAVCPALPADSARAIAALRERNLGDLAARSALRRVPFVKGEANHEAVAALLTGALRDNPDNGEAQRVLGDALLALGRLEEARIHFERALALRPDDALAHRGLGFALHREDRVAEAIPHYEAAIAMGCDEPEVHNNLGAALGQRGDLAGARGHFERALRLRPDFDEARQNLERVRAALGSAPH
jgi:spermidine synthase